MSQSRTTFVGFAVVLALGAGEMAWCVTPVAAQSDGAPTPETAAEAAPGEGVAVEAVPAEAAPAEAAPAEAAPAEVTPADSVPDAPVASPLGAYVAPTAAAAPEPVAEEAEEHGDDIELSAEFGRGATISAGDAFSLTLRARIQFRGALAHATQGAIDAGADEHWGLEFQIRRMRLLLQGHMFAPQLRYYIQLGFSTQDMERDLLIPLRDAQIIWTPFRDFGIRMGQMKVPYGLQRVVSSSALQFADRSIVTGELNIDRDIGLVLFSEDFLGLGGALQYQLGLFGGRGRNRFGGLDSALLAAQIRVNPFGSFDHLSESDQTRSMQPRLSIGASAAYNIDSNRARSTHEQTFQVGRFDFLHLGADVHFKWAGFSLLSEVMFREASEPSATGEIDGEPVTEYSRSGWGWFAQAAYLMEPIPLEVAFRYGEIRPLEQNAAEARFFLQREVGGGISYYVQQHALKVQLDYFYYFGDDPRAERHQVRLQTQLYF